MYDCPRRLEEFPRGDIFKNVLSCMEYIRDVSPPPHAKSRGTVVSRRAVLREYLRTGRYLSIPEQGDSEIIRGQSEKKKKKKVFSFSSLNYSACFLFSQNSSNFGFDYAKFLSPPHTDHTISLFFFFFLSPDACISLRISFSVL